MKRQVLTPHEADTLAARLTRAAPQLAAEIELLVHSHHALGRRVGKLERTYEPRLSLSRRRLEEAVA